MNNNIKDSSLEKNKAILENNKKNIKRKWYQIPFNNKIDEIYLYNYKSLKLITSLITLIFVIFLPFIFDLCNKFIFNNQNQLATGLFILFKFLIIVSIGGYCWFIEKSNFYKNGLIFYYLC